jgi:hypothetical protein
MSDEALDCGAIYQQWRTNTRELHRILALPDRAAHETEANRVRALEKKIEQRLGFNPMLMWHVLGWTGGDEKLPDLEALFKTPMPSLDNQTVLQALRLPDGYFRVQRAFLGDWEPLPPPRDGGIR